MSAAPKRFAVLGDPIAHSKSPSMHTAAFRALGLPHRYDAIRTSAADLGAMVEALRRGAFDGFNVTIPHKKAVLAFVDRRADVTMDAANTLVREADGSITAHNTDVPALAQELLALAPELAHGAKGGTGIVLGTGGAARAAVRALESELGVGRVVVRGRRGHVAPLVPDPDVERQTCVVIQATSAGMEGADPGEAVADAVGWSLLPDHAVALDLVYAPPETPFLRRASARGLRCANGLGMLVRQGALAFRLWLGVDPPLEVMRAALR